MRGQRLTDDEKQRLVELLAAGTPLSRPTGVGIAHCRSERAARRSSYTGDELEGWSCRSSCSERRCRPRVSRVS